MSESVNARVESRRVQLAEQVGGRPGASLRPVRGGSSGIDLEFRPPSYWVPKPTAAARMMRTVGRWLFGASKANNSGLEPGPFEEDADGPIFFGSSPAAMGSGMDLPDLLPNEVEIARLTYTQTVHCEVTSVRAQRWGHRILYRIVDEYGATFDCSPDRSSEPLSLGELIALIDGAAGDSTTSQGLFFGSLQNALDDGEMQVEELGDWIWVSSHYYPDLTRWYREAFHRWAVEAPVERDQDADGPDDD